MIDNGPFPITLAFSLAYFGSRSYSYGTFPQKEIVAKLNIFRQFYQHFCCQKKEFPCCLFSLCLCAPLKNFRKLNFSKLSTYMLSLHYSCAFERLAGQRLVRLGCTQPLLKIKPRWLQQAFSFLGRVKCQF